jgi:hypothetical protein
VRKQTFERASDGRRRDEETFGAWLAKQAAFWLGGPIGLALACVIPGWTLWPDRIAIGTLSIVVWLLWGVPRLGRRLFSAVGNRAHARRYQPHEQDGIWAADAKRNALEQFAAAGLIQPDRQDRAKGGFVPKITDDRPYAAGVEMQCELPPGMAAIHVAAKSAELQSSFRAPYEPEVLAGRHGGEAVIRWPRRNPLDGNSPRATSRAGDDGPWGVL